MSEKCGYLNKNNTCNTYLVCNEKECIARQSNFNNVYSHAVRNIEGQLNNLKNLGKEHNIFKEG